MTTGAWKKEKNERAYYSGTLKPDLGEQIVIPKEGIGFVIYPNGQKNTDKSPDLLVDFFNFTKNQ